VEEKVNLNRPECEKLEDKVLEGVILPSSNFVLRKDIKAR
jgi:hypothetical protein